VPSASHSRTPTPTPTATPTAAPDSEQVTVLSTGFGGFDLQVYPVAMVKNLAAAHTATGVMVSFTVQLRSGTDQISAEPVSLAPGETLAVTVLCTDACVGATGVEATAAVSTWVTGTRTVIAGSAASFTCGSPCAGDPGYQVSVSGSLSGQVASGTLITVTAVCKDGTGNIVGGGSTQTLWAGGDSAPAVLSALTTTPQPASCQLYATEVS
jgi:hypothetical protein